MFEVYGGSGGPVDGDVYVHVGEKFLTLSKAAYEALGEPERVVLLCDRETTVAAIKPVAADERARSIKVRVATSHNGKYTTRRVLASSFIAWCGIEDWIGQRYAAELDEDLGVLVFGPEKIGPSPTGEDS